MKCLSLLLFFLSASISFSQDEGWVKTEGEITEIKVHNGRKTRESAIVTFKLENGDEIQGSVDLVRIPFIGSMKSVGDKITINYKRSNPGLIQTTYGNFLINYGMYILVFFGVILSIKPFLKYRKTRITKN